MKGVFTAAAIFSIATSGFAEPIPIQTGEHESYTRVVLTFEPDSFWQLGRSDAGYILRLDTLDGFNTSGFFRPIPRNRISNVTQTASAGELEFEIACDCHARVFTELGAYLVIDIVDGPAETESVYEARLEPRDLASNIIGTYRPSENGLFPLITQTADVMIQGSDRPMVTDAPLDSASETLAEIVEAVRPTTTADELNEIEQSIVESIARGLSQGLLHSDLKRTDSVAGDNLVIALEELDAQSPGLKATTSVDRSAFPDDPFVPETQEGEICLPSAYFDVSSWGDDRPFSVQIAEARAAITSEFDRLDQSAVEALAKQYLYFGFGEEAIQVLDLDGVNSNYRQYLRALGQIMDGYRADSSLFAQQVSCPSAVSLWALLSGSENGLDGQVDRSAILTTFKALPLHLQPLLGPKLSEKFISIGDNDGAIQALAPLQTKAENTLEGEIAAIDLERALGNEKRANDELSELATEDSRATPALMTAFLEQTVVADLPVTENDFILADSLRFQNEGSPESVDLAIMQVRAYLSNAFFSRAVGLLAEIKDEISAEEYFELENLYVATAAAGMNDANFLEFAFNTETSHLLPGSRELVAQRLLAVGFPRKAYEIASIDSSEPSSISQKLIMAAADLELGRPLMALDQLDGLVGAEVDRLRAIANDRLNFDPVVTDNTVGDPSIEAQWRQGDWQSLLEVDDPLLSDASKAFLETDPVGLDPEKPLASGMSLIEESAQSRAVLEALLDRFTAPNEF